MFQPIKSQAIIGNDIIDWHYAKTQLRKLRPRSLEKLFNTPEINYIDNHEAPFWLFGIYGL